MTITKFLSRVNNYKFRDDFNRDRTYYELKWKPQDIAKAIKDGQEGTGLFFLKNIIYDLQTCMFKTKFYWF